MSTLNELLYDIKTMNDDDSTKDTVNGYIRNVQKEIFCSNKYNDNPYYIIPELAIYLCLLFYNENNKESFDPHIDGKIYKYFENNKRVMRYPFNGLDDEEETLYLSKIARRGIHRWLFKLIEYDSRKFALIIGIWKTKFEMKSENEIYVPTDKFYGLDIQDGSRVGNVSVWRKPKLYLKKEFVKGDEIMMELDLNKLQLRYKINDDYFFTAFNNIEQTEYKAALCIFKDGDTVYLKMYQTFL
eukprot:20237_1